MATSLFTSKKADPHSVRTAWYSLLAVPDSILVPKDLGLKAAKLVLDATQHGVVVYPVRARAVDGQRSYKIDFKDDTAWEYIHITNLGDYVCQALDIVPPACCKEIGDHGKPAGIRALPATTVMAGYLRFSLDNGFPLMHNPHMKKLVADLGVPCDKIPDLEMDVFKLLAHYIRPDISDADLVQLCLKRGWKSRKVVYGTVIGSADIASMVDDCCSPDQKLEIVEAAKTFQKQVDAMKEVLPPAAKAKAAAKGKKAKKFGMKDLDVLEAAKKLLPDGVDGCTLTLETEWHTRWKIVYPTRFPPGQTSCCYTEGDANSRRSALFFCLQWAWTHHEIQTNAVCPWDFS